MSQESAPARACLCCGAPVAECMGFVIAGDFLRRAASPTPSPVRELCGRCAAGALDASPAEIEATLCPA